MKLSVLIPSIPSRHDFLSRILGILGPQLTNEVQVLINLSTPSRSGIDDGAKTIGEKRNALLWKAEGDYVVFVDDDDRVSDDYIGHLLCGIYKGVDVVSIRGEVIRNGRPFGIFIDTPYTRWRTERVDNQQVFLRGVQHLDAIRREIALTQKFEPRSFSEDHRWSAAIEQSRLVKSWHLIEKTVYYYDEVLPVRETGPHVLTRDKTGARVISE